MYPIGNWWLCFYNEYRQYRISEHNITDLKQTETNQINDFISVAEANKLFGYNSDYVSSLCRSGKIYGRKFGRNWVVSRTALETFIQNKRLEQSCESTLRMVPVEGQLAPELSDVALSKVMQSAVELQLSALRERIKAGSVLRQVGALQGSLRSVEHKLEQLAQGQLSSQESADQRSEVVTPASEVYIRTENLQPNRWSRFLAIGIGAFALFVFLVNTVSGIPYSSVSVTDLRGRTSTNSKGVAMLHGASANGDDESARVAGAVTGQKSILGQAYSQPLIPNFSLRDLDQLILSNINQIVAAGWLQNNSSHALNSSQPGIAQSNSSAPLTGGQTFAPIYYYPPVSSIPSSGGSIFAATDLSSEHFTTTDALVKNNVTVQHDVVVQGSILGAVNPGLAVGSVLFQGPNGIAEDSTKFFWDNTTKALGIGTATPDVSAALDIFSTTKGLLAPRMSAVNRDAIVAPAAGLLIFNTTTSKYNYYNGAVWVTVDSGSGPVSSAWNDLTDPTGNLALSMANRTSTFTYNAATGVSNLFNLTDGVGNTGSGYLLNVVGAAGSTIKPLKVTANGADVLTVNAVGAINLPALSANRVLFTDGSKNITTSGSVASAQGGTGVDTSVATGVPYISAGTWSVDANALASTHGGTGNTTYAAGDMLYYTAGASLSKLGIGAAGTVLVSTGTAPSWGTLGAAAITPNSLDFSEFKNALTLDASTDVAVTGSNIFSITNIGSGNSFVVNDQASDSTPFVIDGNGKTTVAASSTTSAGLNIPTGVAPSVPVAGDFWNQSGSLKFYDGSVSHALTYAGDLANTSDPAKGDALVGFKQTGTGGVARTVHDKLNEITSVTDFGAIGDGSTNNAVALQAAINNGGQVIIPEGTFNFGTTLTLKKDTTIVGKGKSSILRFTGSGAALREAVGSYSGGYDNIKLKDFTLTTNSATSTKGIELTDNYQVTIDGVYIDGNNQTGFTIAGIHVLSSSVSQNSAIIRITNGEIWLVGGDAIRTSGPGGVAAVWVEHMHLTGAGGWGVNETIPAPPYPQSNLQINNNVIEGNVAGAVNIDNAQATTISGNYFENIDGSTATLVRISSVGAPRGIEIKHNVFGGKAADYLIALLSPSGMTGEISNNTFSSANIAAINATDTRGVSIFNNFNDGSIPTLVAVGTAAQGLFIQDGSSLQLTAGATAPQPTLSVSGSIISPVFSYTGDVTLATTAGNANVILDPNGTGSVRVPSAVTTGSNLNAGLSVTANSLTSGQGVSVFSSSLTSGSLVDISVSSTTASANTQTGLNVFTTGVNGTSTQNTYAAQISNTHSGTNATNIGLFSNASGGTSNYGLFATASGGTNNFAAVFDQGNVGINTVAPTLAKLQIHQDSTYSSESGGAIYIRGASADSSLILGSDATNDISYIQSMQNGTSFTTRPLALQPNGGSVVIGSATAEVCCSVNAALKINPGSNAPLYISNGSMDFLYINSSGNVGVGSITASNKLSVYGGGSIGVGYVSTAAPTNGLLVEGGVGIGTTTPSTFKLEVAGSIGPEADNTRNLGSGGRRYANVYAANFVGAVTPSGFTQGSVVFAGNSGVLSQDNSNLFYDSTAQRLGIGDATPAAQLTVGSGDKFQVASTGTLLFNGVTTDITTGTNESLFISPNGTGSVIVNSGVTSGSGSGSGFSVTSSTLSSGVLATFNSTSAAASGNTQTVLAVTSSGTNVNSGQLTYGATISNSHGTDGVNIGLSLDAYNGATNYALYAATGMAYFGASLGVGTTGPDRAVEINAATGNNVRLTYNDSNGSAANFVDLLTTPSGAFTVQPSGFVVNVGGGTTRTALRFLEPSGAGSEYVALQAHSNVTTSYTWTLPAADASGCIQSNGSGALSIASCGGSVTPWSSAIDADGFSLQDALNIEFRTAAGSAPAGSVAAVYADNSGDVTVNALSGKSFNIGVNGADEYVFSATALALNGNNITGVGTALTAAAGLAVTATAADLALATATSGNITLAPGGVGSVQVTSSVTSGTGTASGLSLVANALTSGVGMSISSSSLSSGSLLALSATATAAASNTQTVLNVSTSGANATASQTTYGAYMANTHTGTTSTNIGLYVTASGGTNNYAAIFDAGKVGIGTMAPTFHLDVVGTGDQAVMIQSTNNNDTFIRFSNPDFQEWDIGLKQSVTGTGSDRSLVIRDTTAAAIRLQVTNSGNVVIGTGEGATPTGNMLRGPNAAGTNIAAGTFTIAAGLATGTGTVGVLQLQAAPSKSASGSSLDSLATLLQVGNTHTAQVGTVGAFLSQPSQTYTDRDTATSGTATNAVFNSFAQPTLAASNTGVTTTNAATLYIANAPAAGTNQTITNAYALWVDAGAVRLDGASGGGGISVALGATASTNAVCSSLANTTAPTAGTAYELRDCNAAPAADYAEQYPVEQGIEVGDVVVTGATMVHTYDELKGSVDWSRIKGDVPQLVRGTVAYQATVVGIVSDNVGDFTSAGYNIKPEDNPKSIALNGRVPVKVSDENGSIRPGDYLTVSATKPGFAMKASRAGTVIGMALEAYPKLVTEHSEGDKIMVFMNIHSWVPSAAVLLANQSSSLFGNADVAALNILDASTFGDLVVSGTAYVQEDIHVKGVLFAGRIETSVLMTKQLCIEDLCVNRQQLQSLLDLLSSEGQSAAAGAAASVEQEYELTSAPPALSPE